MMGELAFVFDPALPGLAAALDAGVMTPKLAELLRVHCQAAPYRVIGVELLKHKPGRRCSLAYAIEGPTGRERVFAKTFKNDRGASVLETMELVSRAASGSPLIVPRPLGYLAELKMLVTTFIDGKPLAREMYDGSHEAARRMATALAALHRLPVACSGRWDADDELRNTLRWVDGPGFSNGSVRAGLRRQVRFLQHWVRSVGVSEAHPVHRDFYPEQLLDTGRSVALIDLDDTRMGDPAVDVGNFLAHLTLRSLQFPHTTRACREARRVFLTAYEARGGWPVDRRRDRRVRFYETASLVRLAGVYNRRERWARLLPPRLLEASDAVINDGRLDP